MPLTFSQIHEIIGAYRRRYPNADYEEIRRELERHDRDSFKIDRRGGVNSVRTE